MGFSGTPCFSAKLKLRVLRRSRATVHLRTHLSCGGQSFLPEIEFDGESAMYVSPKTMQDRNCAFNVRCRVINSKNRRFNVGRAHRFQKTMRKITILCTRCVSKRTPRYSGQFTMQDFDIQRFELRPNVSYILFIGNTQWLLSGKVWIERGQGLAENLLAETAKTLELQPVGL
jgi:hypothetical protein